MSSTPTPSTNSRALKAFLSYAFSLTLAAIFICWAFEGIDLTTIWQAARQSSTGWLAMIVLTTLCTVAIRAWRWVVLLKGVTRVVTVTDATLALAICYSANIVAPRAGEAARALSLKWQRDVSVSATLGTVVVERILDMVWLIFFVGLSLSVIPSRLETEYPLLVSGSLLMLGGCALLVALLAYACATGESGIEIVEVQLSRISARIAGPATEILRKFVVGLTSVSGKGAYVRIFVSSAILNAGYVLIIYESFYAFGLHQSHSLGAAAALVVMAISSIGIVIPVQGGIGAYHFLFANTLETLYSVDAAAALACATVVHALGNITYLTIGVPALLLQRYQSRRNAA